MSFSDVDPMNVDIVKCVSLAVFNSSACLSSHACGAALSLRRMSRKQRLNK